MTHTKMLDFLRRLWTYTHPYRGRLFLGLFFGVLYAITNGLLVVVIKLAVDVIFAPAGSQVTVVEYMKKVKIIRPWAESLAQMLPALKTPSSRTAITLVIGLIPAVMLLKGIFAYLNVYLSNWAAIRAVAALRRKLFEHLQSLSLDFFNTARTGDLISRITSDTQVLYSIVGNALASAIRDPIAIICLLVLLLSQDPTLTLISFVVIPACLLPILIYGRKIRTSAGKVQTHLAELSNLMHESFSATRIIKAYNLEKTMREEFDARTRKYISQVMRIVRANEIPGQITEFLGAVGVAMVLYYVRLVVGGGSHKMELSDFISFITGIFLMYQPIKSLTKLHNQLEQARAASRRVFELLDTVSSVREPASPVPLKAAGTDIEFKDVDFAYGDKSVLRGINLTVKAGQLVALVGSSGSGKTTLTNLLLRFYDPQRGAVRIGGTDIRQVSIADLRRQVALVAQETLLFNDTVRFNIAVGRPGATDAEIETAARHAFAHEFITEKTDGYQTIVGERGATLSMGQRQRLTIARAILKDAPILILDEAMSALDTKSERVVQDALEELMVGRTTICIAHRLSTIQNADVIVVLHDGRIVESGTHDALMKARGAYCRLYELQFEPAMA
jgi:ATP-binding cassette, subfamily B, bacterial MsbA